MELFLLLMIFGAVRNFYRARARYLNAPRWALYTFVSMPVATVLGAVLLSIIFVGRHRELYAGGASPSRMENEALARQFAGSLQAWAFLLICAAGGYLFIRYRIDRQVPGQPPPEEEPDL